MGKIVDWLLDFLYAIAQIAIGWLPDSPFQTQGFEDALSSFSGIMSNINYFVPFGGMLAITTVYLSAVLIWYGARWVLRLAQYID
jgi:hypothetical protein